ncbi:hypothetical protein OXYTRIMIC_132 [Oxytricha trifallax]|uniref:Uncharacterized protein n=1 Tax=Oxytricha trifallax TaxID=1172189 RepID=A0A073HYD3_9SPIT|nr:hypothetical protein OXYTRIMIC_132 [Oxytricha trifallax]
MKIPFDKQELIEIYEKFDGKINWDQLDENQLEGKIILFDTVSNKAILKLQGEDDDRNIKVQTTLIFNEQL